METPTIMKVGVFVSPDKQGNKMVKVNQYTNNPTNPDNKKCSAGIHSKLHPLSFILAIISDMGYCL